MVCACVPVFLVLMSGLFWLSKRPPRILPKGTDTSNMEGQQEWILQDGLDVIGLSLTLYSDYFVQVIVSSPPPSCSLIACAPHPLESTGTPAHQHTGTSTNHRSSRRASLPTSAGLCGQRGNLLPVRPTDKPQQGWIWENYNWV